MSEGALNKAVIVSTAVRQHLLFFLRICHNSLAAVRQKHSRPDFFFYPPVSASDSFFFLLLSFWLSLPFDQLNHQGQVLTFAESV